MKETVELLRDDEAKYNIEAILKRLSKYMETSKSRCLVCHKEVINTEPCCDDSDYYREMYQ